MADLTQAQAIRRLTFGGEWPMDLSGLDFSQSIVRQTDWRRRDLHEADFRGARFYEVWLVAANLREVKAQAATFEAVDGRDAILDSGDFRNTNWSRSHLGNVQAHDARFDHAVLGAVLRDGDFTGSDFRYVDLTHNDLRNANFSYTILVNVKLPTRRSLWHMNLEGALLIGAQWQNPEDLHRVLGLPKYKCGLQVLDQSPRTSRVFQVEAYEQGWSVLGQDLAGTTVWFGADEVEDLLVLHDWAVQQGFVHQQILDPLKCFAVAQTRRDSLTQRQRQLKNRLLR